MNLSRREFIRVLGAGSAAALAGQGCGAREQKPSPGGLLFSFGAIADIQYRNADTAANRYFRASIQKLQACVAHLNALRPDFVLELGDLIDADFSSLRRILPFLQQLKTPVYPVVGNHDILMEWESRESAWRMLGFDRRGSGKGYYDFPHKGWRFVALNGADVSVFAHPPGTPQHDMAAEWLARLKEQEAPNAYEWNGAVGPEQLQWLETTLERASKAGEKAIVFSHFPVWPTSNHLLWNHAEVRRVLESQPCVAAYICGHQHNGDYEVKNGVHYLTLRGMVETPETAYSLIQVFPDHLRVVAYGRETSREIRFNAAK